MTRAANQSCSSQAVLGTQVWYRESSGNHPFRQMSAARQAHASCQVRAASDPAQLAAQSSPTTSQSHDLSFGTDLTPSPRAQTIQQHPFLGVAQTQHPFSNVHHAMCNHCPNAAPSPLSHQYEGRCTGRAQTLHHFQ